MDPPPRAGGPTAAELTKKARTAWMAGQCGKAISLAKKANRKKYSSSNIRIIGVCACTLRRKSTARWAYKRLRGGQRNNIMQFCKSKGINLP